MTERRGRSFSLAQARKKTVFGVALQRAIESVDVDRAARFRVAPSNGVTAVL